MLGNELFPLQISKCLSYPIHCSIDGLGGISTAHERERGALHLAGRHGSRCRALKQFPCVREELINFVGGIASAHSPHRAKHLCHLVLLCSQLAACPIDLSAASVANGCRYTVCD